MSYNNRWFPLFPLKTVLFPGGILPLKVYETRYIDMVQECMRQNAPFGIVLIKSGQDAEALIEPETVGCLAHVSQWDMPSAGMIRLRALGGERFRILETRTLPDQRLEGRIEIMEADSAIPISSMHVACAQALNIVIDDTDAKGKAEHGSSFDSPFARPIQLDSAAWVANRWCEILPIPLKARQKLLELNDAGSRLSIVYQYLQQHKIL